LENFTNIFHVFLHQSGHRSLLLGSTTYPLQQHLLTPLVIPKIFDYFCWCDNSGGWLHW